MKYFKFAKLQAATDPYSIPGISEDDVKEVYRFLEDLRKSGVTNMFGAAVYIEDEFGYDERLCSTLLAAWMNNYDQICKELGLRDLFASRRLKAAPYLDDAKYENIIKDKLYDIYNWNATIVGLMSSSAYSRFKTEAQAAFTDVFDWLQDVGIKKFSGMPFKGANAIDSAFLEDLGNFIKDLPIKLCEDIIMSSGLDENKRYGDQDDLFHYYNKLEDDFNQLVNLIRAT
jgi:hypothetical protein